MHAIQLSCKNNEHKADLNFIVKSYRGNEILMTKFKISSSLVIAYPRFHSLQLIDENKALFSN